MDEEAYINRVTRVYELVLKSRMQKVLTRLAEELRIAEYEPGEPFDMSDDEYRWELMVEGNGLVEPVDIRVELAESLSYGDGVDGVNLCLHIGGYGGEIIGDLTPYNYTPECWASLKDLHEVDRRMKIIEQVDMEEVVRLIDAFRDRKREEVNA